MGHILHFGIGNFHRAHQAWYTQVAGGWTITGVSLRSAGIRDLLAPQGCDYTLVVRGQDRVEDMRVEVIDRVLVAPEEPEEVLAALADPAVKIVSMTVTEKGYHLDGDGKLDLAAPDVAHDLDAELPRTLVGFLARGLALRWQAGDAPVTVMCCDNLTDNGDKLRASVAAFAAAAGLDLGDRLDRLATFPNAMVDRITPATTDALRAEVAARTGWDDAAPVSTEAFTEWVIEDDFATPRPNWEAGGAQFVSDVAPFEMRKLRLLNGAHSYLAYFGQLRGHTYVHEAIADAEILADARALMTAAAATLPELSAVDAPAYADDLIARFANPSLRHELRQIAMDGTAKIPIRWLGTLADRPGTAVLEKALAAWVAYVWREVAAGRALDDPAAGSLAGICADARDREAALASLLEVLDGSGQLAETHGAAIAAHLARIEV